MFNKPDRFKQFHRPPLLPRSHPAGELAATGHPCSPPSSSLHGLRRLSLASNRLGGAIPGELGGAG
jgi:hypothetical protein